MAEQNTHCFPMAALFVKKRRIISCSCNHYKTHPLQVEWARKNKTNKRREYLHAEIAAASGVDFEELYDSTCYVVRTNRAGQMMCSYPCEVCYPFLKHLGVKRIVCCSAYGEAVGIEM